MGGKITICPYLAAMDVLPAQLSCSCEASSWSFSVLPGQHDARAASQGLLHTLPWQCPVTEDRIPVIVKNSPLPNVPLGTAAGLNLLAL